nr:serine/threonine protein kinase [Thermoanaerobaculia bacterium]
MPDELWLQVEELFAQAVTLPPPERPSFLDRATTDPDLRSEVERLLAADASAGPFIERAIERGALALARDEEVELLGQKVGEWRLASVLGQGGMGTVYLAEPA